MKELFVTSKNVNLEILAKLLNSVAKKYDCYVQYLSCENSLKFHGEEACWRPIIEEVVAFFFPKAKTVPAMAPVDDR
jgi:hypothetical protein